MCAQLSRKQTIIFAAELSKTAMNLSKVNINKYFSQCNNLYDRLLYKNKTQHTPITYDYKINFWEKWIIYDYNKISI